MSGKIAAISAKYVRFIPNEIESGVLYVSKKYGTAVHLCCCGCGSRVVTPLGPVAWRLAESRKGVSLYPSIGNWAFACRSHYWITNGRVHWSYRMTDNAIALGRLRDEEERKAHFENEAANDNSNAVSPPEPNNTVGEKIREALRRLFPR